MNEVALNNEDVSKLLTFDIKTLINLAVNKEPDDYKTIISNGYVHAGIAFFGGGKNYGLFEDNANSNLEDKI